MAVARIDQGPYRRYSSPAPRQYQIERPAPAFLSLKTLIVGLVVSGALLQHVLVSTPLEPQPTRLAVSTSPNASPALTQPKPADPKPAPHVQPAPKTQPATEAQPTHHAPAAPLPLPSIKQPKAAAPARADASASRPTIVLPPVGAFGDAHRIAMAANAGGDIMHVPSVSVAAIRAALQAAGSPVLDAHYADHKDAAEYIWDSGRILGVDPAVVMAIFYHESVFGTQGMARQTLSVGNIRPLPGQPQLDGYRLYSSWQEGIDDCYRLLLSYAHNGAATIPQAIPVWAPPSDNNDDSAYISSVLGTMSSLYASSAKP